MIEKLTDYEIAQKFISKAQHAKVSDTPFELSFTSFKNMMLAKKCQYTGIEFTQGNNNGRQLATDRTIDRIDASKGYVKGNVVVVCYAANQFKSLFENPGYSVTPKAARKILDIIEKTKK